MGRRPKKKQAGAFGAALNGNAAVIRNGASKATPTAETLLILPLSEAERLELAECRLRVDAVAASLVVGGRALRAIHDKNPHRETHESFEDFCRSHWGYSRSYAHRLIYLADIIDVLS